MSQRLVTSVFAVTILLTLAATTVPAQVSKGQQILINQGLQVQGMVNVGDPFHLTTYQNLNYSAINWLWDANHSLNGAAPGTMPWARWVRPGTNPPSTAEMPGGGETPYMSKMVALSLGD